MDENGLIDWVDSWLQSQRELYPSPYPSFEGLGEYELWVRPGLSNMIEGLGYRAYARLINHSRRPRKISWKHLNRYQRERALELFLYQEAKNNG